MDAKGGFYITDPQFTPEAKKSQPGKQVYYLAADGTARVVIGPGEYAMPNGVELSPDGKTLYVNNTWLQPGENFVWAYDVAADGSLSNKRQFAMLGLTPDVLEASQPADRFDSGADGTAVDTDGRYYVATTRRASRSSCRTVPPPAPSRCHNIRSASPSADRTTTCCIWWGNRPCGRSRPRFGDSVILPRMN